MIKKVIPVLFLLFFAVPVWAAGYASVDSRARNTPFKYTETIPKLVEYLTKPYRNDEEKKARVIFAWIVYHIDYDMYQVRASDEMVAKKNSRIRKGLPRAPNIFEAWLGVCGDIAELYQKMATEAGLEAVVIGGFADTPKVTRKTFEGAGHAWNAVKIDGEWQLLDATWSISAMGQVYQNIKSDSAYERAIEKRKKSFNKKRKETNNRKIDGSWFLTKPGEFIKTHYPDNPNWQLLKNPKKIPGAPSVF